MRALSPSLSLRGHPVSAVTVPSVPPRRQCLLGWAVANGMSPFAAARRYGVKGGRGPAKLPDEPVIFALWHNRLALCMKVYESFVRPRHSQDHLAGLTSACKEGALLAAILEASGTQVARDSSNRRGAQALLELTSWAALSEKRRPPMTHD